MEKLKSVFTRIGGKGVIGLVLFGGLLVYAAVIDRTVYVSEQMLLLPGSFTTTDWQNPQGSLIQDLDDFALYQEFTENNSARLSRQTLLEPEPSAPVDSENQFTETVPAEESVDGEVSPPSAEGSVVPEESVSEPISIEGESVSVQTGQFRLAQEEVVEPVAVEETTSEPVAGENQETPEVETSTAEESVAEQIQSVEVQSTDDSTAGSETVQSEPAETVEAEAPGPTAYDECAAETNCTSHSIVYDNFNIPEFERGTVLDGVQIRLSLAAQLKERSNAIQRFVIEYSYDDVVWEVASLIDIEDEVSNSINGGFFLATVPEPPVAASLTDLSVRVTYQGDVENLESAFVEAVWLELTSGTFYEEGDPFYNTDTIEYDRELAKPQFHTLHNEGTDVSLGTLPSFTMSYDPQQNFLRRIFTALVSENMYEVGQVQLTDGDGIRVEIPFEIIYHDDTTWTVEMAKQPQKMKPGKYRLEVTVQENDEQFVDVIEFYWGVLAINSTKSMYFQNEAVTLNLAALTDKGDTICNAELSLQVIDPSNNIYDVPVQQTGACGPNNVTDIPDYVADFRNTGELGLYQIILEHRNQAGEVVHKITDSFEVRDYIPYDITRTAPTRIYPPAPYTVTLSIKANRSFTGDIVERVPRGFVFAETSGAEVTTLPDATLLTWNDVVMQEGDTLELSYVFDAPDISPYMYLLGPLDMDGFKELRQWHIASDAISSAALLRGTQTELGTNLNDTTPGALLWSTSTLDNFYFSHSTTTDPERLFVTKDGDYAVSVTLPLERNDANGNWTRVGFEVRVNGTVVPHAVGRSGLISNIAGGGDRHNQASGHGNFLLTNLSAGDYIEVYAVALTSVTAARPITITGQASLYVEHIPNTTPVFAATATSTVASTTLNTTASELRWTETRQDTGFLHSNTITPEDIILTDPGTYLVYVNMPFEATGGTNPYRNVLGRVLLDGTQVPGGVFSQGTLIVTADSDNDSSSHWSGVVVATTSNQILSVSMEQEGAPGTVTAPAGFTGSILIQKLPTEDVIALRGRDLSGGTNWNVTPAQTILWDTQLAYDSTVFTHSPTVNSNVITINESGDYLLAYNDALVIAGGTNNVAISVRVNGVPRSGAQTKTHYTSNTGGQQDSSGSLVFALEGLSPGDTISVEALRDGNNTVANDRTDAMLLLWKKKELNFRPGEATMHNVPFDNIRFASTTPRFEFTNTDPDGTSDLVYEFMIATSSDFSGAISRVSDVALGFTNTVSATDTSPFIEGQRIRFQLQAADALQNNTTYYWRVRAKDVSGSNEFGDWSTTQSLTIDTTVDVPDWFQTTDAQFLSNQLTGVASAEGNGAVVDIVENTEAMLVYGEKTDTFIKYRLWDGSAWSAETNGPNIGAEIYWAETSAGNRRDEYVSLFLTADGDVNAMVFNGASSTWANQVEFETAVNTPARRGIAVVHESVSGDALAISCSVGVNPVYTIWNGTSWSATSSISVGTASNCNWLTVAADPNSDEVILMVKGAANNYEAVVWDGSAWGNNKVLGRAAGTNLATDGMSVVYEASGDQALIVSSDAGDNEFVYSAWNGTDWLININVPVSSDFENGQLVRDEGTDRIGFCMVDDGADINAFLWDGTAWGTETQLEPTTESIQSRPFDCLFETIPGRDGTFLVPYSNDLNDEYQFFGTTWSGPLEMSNMEEFWYLQTVRTGDGTVLAVGMENAGIDPLRASEFNGTSWTASTLIEADPAEIGVDPRSESFALAAKRFSFAQGELLTQPINFNFVPGRTTWGDLSFNTTEPIGTSVTVRVKYSNVGVCDSYIPNGALPGNGTGFTVASGTINLSGLSTSTYSQLCLEATITRNGDISASLDDWNLTWVRQPKLIQNQYRWYTNGSFLTPSDAWPAGVVNLAENTPLSPNEAINAAETIRLRLSLQGANINLSPGTETFKLQYAEGLTCSPSLNWQDVGSAASSTAIWRGFENSIVGTDWLSASWKRRVKVTVEGTLVNGPQTDFPVYVNLADLPASFFSAVQSDGDDIRVTNASGTVELPFELVSINTTTRRGELHFRATLASTTDTDFYIYYDNPSASGYAANAPFGRNNVWTNGYEAVYHLETNPANNMIDSTANGRTLTTNGGMTASNSTTSVLGQGVDFDGINDRLTNSGWAWTATPVTVTAWNNVTTAETRISNLFGFTAVGNERLAAHAPWSDSILYWDYGTCCAPPGRLTTNYATFRNKWTHVGLVSQGTPGTFMGIYLDGSLVASAATSDDPNVTLTGFSLGSDNPGGGNHHDGRIDEFRIASVARSAGWIQTERNNQVNPTGFYALSAEELIGDGRNLPSTVLSVSDHAETYEEQNPTRENQNLIVVGNDAEWDFVLQNNLGVPNTNYCFRLTYADGALLSSYERYPRLVTNAPPLEPELFAPFDNEQLASTTPWFEFAAADELDDAVSYQIEIDNNSDFSSPVITRESSADFAQFENLSAPAERGIYTPGQIVRFISTTPLSDNTTYYWRVRARDTNGSGAYGPWSGRDSFTVSSATTITTWFQTMQPQFDTNDLQNTIATVSDDIRIAPTFTTGTSTSNPIEYADVDTGNAWGELLFVDDESTGDITYAIEYLVAGNEWQLVPDTVLPGNAAGFDTSGVSLANLNPETYHTLRIRAVLTGNDSLPRLQSWAITWGERIEAPRITTPFDNAKVSTTTPRFIFTTSDPQGDALSYEIQIGGDSAFSIANTYVSGVDSGFVNLDTPIQSSPFTSGQTIQYTVQSPFVNGQTYWYRVRARDPLGENSYSNWSEPRSFTVDETVVVSTWHQTTGDQFATGETENAEFTLTDTGVTSEIRGALVVYGESTSLNPRYRLWDGEGWSDPRIAGSVDALIQWSRVVAGVTRNEYALATLGNDGDVNVQIYDVNNGTWGNQVELSTTIPNVGYRGMDIAYETISGELLAVSCEGQDALFRTWNGLSWTGTSTLNLTKATNCEFVQMASDPTSNEIIAVFRNEATGSPDYEVWVWNGSAWGNQVSFGDYSEAENEGISVEYETSGNQAVVVITNATNPSFFYNTWNGSSWSGVLTHALQNDFENGVLKRNPFNDEMALCYIDEESDLGTVFWNGAAWGSFLEHEQTANSKDGGRPVSCEFEVTPGREEYLMIPYSDGFTTNYTVYATSSYSGELLIGTITDTWTTQTIRTAEGLILGVFLQDEGTAPADRYEFAYWDGTGWQGQETLSTVPSVTTIPMYESISMAAQVFPSVTTARITSTPIDFDDGGGPRWQTIEFSDVTPGGSYVEYRVFYENLAGEYVLVPLPGNSAGFTNGPIDISSLDPEIYNRLRLEARLFCVSGDCPRVNDWTVEWSEGVTISGLAFAYDQTTPLTSGTVGVAVNGVLQVGKVGTISSSTAVQQALFSTVGTTTWTVPAGVTQVTAEVWGAGGGGGGGGISDAGGNGGGAGFVSGTIAVTPGENLEVRVGGGGQPGLEGSPAGGGGGGGYSALYRTSTPLFVAAGGGGGGAGSGGIEYLGVGTACAVSGATCTPTIPANTAEHDLMIAVVHSRTDTAHTCTTNCTGWTEFSTQAGGNGRLSVWYFRRTGTTPPNPTFAGPATDTYTARIWAFRGVHRTGDPFNVVSANTAQAAVSPYTGASLTSTLDNVMTVFVGASIDDNTWGPASGGCTVPTGVDANFYATNINGNDNSLFLCYNNQPTNTAGPLGVPSIAQVANATDAGRWFTFALRPNTVSQQLAGVGGPGGGILGLTGSSSAGSIGGSGGTQVAGGAGGGSGTAGTSLSGGSGGAGGTGGGTGGAGGALGGGAGGAGGGAAALAGGGGGGAGFFGGGGGAQAFVSTTSAAGGGGGSSFIATTSIATSTQSGNGITPGGSTQPRYVSGIGVGGAGGATSSNGVAGGNGLVAVSWLGTTTPGVWSIPNVNVEAGDIVTVFITGADGTREAVAVTKYSGAGDVTGMQLSERTLTLGSADNPTLSNPEIGLYEFDDNEDIFFGVNAGNELQLCEDVTCADARLRILAGTTYQPLTNSRLINFENTGIFSPGTSTQRVAGSWRQNGTFNTGASTIHFTATSSSSTLETATSTHSFFNVTFGEIAGFATWNITKPLEALGTLTLDRGVLQRATTSLSIGNNLTINANGTISGLGTTTFTGSGSSVWTDVSTSSTNIGQAVIDGTAKTITLGSGVRAQSVLIGTDDTLNASGSNFPITVLGSWTNNNSFIPQGGTVFFSGTSSVVINRGTSAFNNITFNGVGGSYSFSTTTLALNGSLTIATGTVTLPTGTTTIGRSFVNSGGTFLHNNGEVRMTSTVAGQTITQRAGTFTNAFNNLTFVGSGAWSFTETAATTTRNFSIQAGTVTFPSGQLTVGGDFTTTGSGTFLHNSGEVVLLVGGNNSVSTGNSSFNNLRTRGAGGSWYNTNWSARKQVLIPTSQVGGTLTDFPVYVNLANLGSDFFTTVRSDGADIRVTTADGVTEVPVEIVSISTSTQSGELHFRAPNLGTSTANTFFIYYGNAGATAYAPTDPFGRNNVWSNGYEAVYHLGTNPVSTTLDSTRHGRNLVSAGGMVAGNSVPGVLGNAVDFEAGTNDYLRNTTFAWANATNSVTVTAWNNVASSEVSASNLFGFTESGGERFASHAPFNDSVIYWDFGTCCNTGTSRLNTSYAAYLNKWTHIAMVSTGGAGSFMGLYLDGSLITSSTGAIEDPIATLTGFGLGALSSSGGALHNGRIDEFRIASVVRSAAWITTERNNQASTSAFYTVGAVESRSTRTFTSASSTIIGNFILDTGGDAVFPSGTLSIGGSFDNNATFNANSGTVRFNSSAGTETVAAGNSWFSTVEFTNASGNYIVSEHATASVAIRLLDANIFTVQSGQSLTTLRDFTNAIPGPNTTWTGATLVLAGNNDVTTSAKNYVGDVYGTLRTTGTTTARLWNSSATVYDTVASSSIYSQDHAGVDGDLFIFGDYIRNTGSEQWSFATDFDGAALTTGRRVNVRFENGATFLLSNASLFMQGSTSASTTVAAQSGQYSFESRNGTINAVNFAVSQTNTAGLQLLSSTTIAQFTEGLFTVTPGRTGVTIDGTTVSRNPAAQYIGIDFATTTAGAATNVTFTGTTTSFVWFRDGAGNLYGEAFDAGDGNPGVIRFDDSSFLITISGRVFADDGVTSLGAPTCDGVTQNVRVVVNGGTYTGTTSCNPTTGAYTLTNVSYNGDARVVVYLNTNGGSVGSVVTKTPVTNITDMDIYANRVIVRHEDVAPVTIADMTSFQSSNDSDVRFVATSSQLTTLPNTSLFVWNNKTFIPGGNVTLTGNANSNGFEGTLQVGPGATFRATGNETHSLAGRFVLATTSQFVAASSTVVFTATTTGKSITSPNTITFNQLQFTGGNGGWHITAPLIVQQNMTVSSGTVTGTSNITIENGSFLGNGVVSLGAGTTTINRTNTLGGTTPWTFANLVLGNGVVGTTTPAGTATTTILGRLTIAAAHILDANDGRFDFAGSGTVFVEQGTFLEDTSTVRYSGGTGATVLNTAYHNLVINAGAGTPTFTAAGLGLLVRNNLTVGGAAPSTFTVAPNNTQLDVDGSVTITANGTLVASNVSSLLVGGSWSNTGTFTAANGTVVFDGVGSSTISAGASPFANLTLNGTGQISIITNATTSQNFTIASTTTFTQNSGTILAVGGRLSNDSAGGNTTWTGSTLALYGGGQYVVNSKSSSDTYNGTVVVSGTAQPRFWNSSFSALQTTGGGSVYSMNHAGVSGDLFIYGAYNNILFNDHWSFATDFDGSTLGSPRQVDVFVASGGSVTYSSSSLSAIGTSTASTTIQNQGSGTYSFTIASTSAATLQYLTPRDLSASGIVLTGTPNVIDISNVDFLIQTNSASALTVAGSVIDANPAKNLNRNRFEAAGGVTNAINVTTTGTAVSSWRFTNESGNRAGESYDADSGNPGEIVWTDSAALITISGRVFSDEGSTASAVCDGVTPNVRLVVAGLTSASTTCNGSGAYTFTNVGFNTNDSLIVYLDGEVEKAATVTYQPLSNITNMDLYESRVIVRHEGATPISIAELAVYDNSDDTDIPFTADTVVSPDTLVLPADRKLLVWNNREFSPNGNVTVTGGGGGASFDGTLEARSGGRFTARTGETHTVGGSLIFGTGALFTAASSTVVLTTDDTARVIDVNAASFNNLTISGPGQLSVTDDTLTILGTYTQTSGTVTFPTGTTTIGSSFIASGGDFNINGSPLLFTSTQTGRIVTFGDSNVAEITFAGVGGAWNMNDVNATSTGSITVASGTVTLPSGTFTIGGSFRNTGGTLLHNTSELVFTSATAQELLARGSDLHSIRQAGVGTLTMLDGSVTLLGSMVVSAGSLNVATNTVAIGGSLIAVGGTFNSASGTILMNGVTSGLTINPGSSRFHNLQIGAPSGSYTMSSATTSNLFTIAAVNNLTVSPGASIRVEGVFSNAAGANTTWSGTTLVLAAQTSYSVNTRTQSGDFYDTLIVGDNADIRFWYSRATTTTVSPSASLYSQDHANVNGALTIYGDFVIATTTEYWSFATDFDGTSLLGSERKVTVRHAPSATTTVQSGGLQIIGTSGSTTDITRETTGSYGVIVSGGTFTATHYSFNHLNASGLQLLGTPTITNLANGYYELATSTGTLITLSSTTLNANASKVFNNVGFNAVNPLTGFNVTLVGETDNAWRFTNSYGTLSGEAFDVDGLDACGSIRFDDSACLLTEQTQYRWRNDDGGLGVPNSEWFNTNWSKRKRIRIDNPVNQAYSSTSVKLAIAYDSDMQTNFTDLRFTADDGITEIPYWIERVTASTDAVVWVRVPSLPANGQAVIHMYYGNSGVSSSTSNGAAVFETFEDFESNSLSAYTGDTALFQTDTTPVFGGTYALESANKNGRTTSGIFRFDRTVSQGQIIRYMQYVDTTAGSGDEACTLFGVQSPGTTNLNYAVCLEQFGTDRIALARDVKNNDVSGTVLASRNVTYATGWYEVEVDWRTNNSINVSLFNAAGSLVATTSATDSSYTSGGIGFAFWFNYGSWDSYTARTRTNAPPQVFIGAEQERGGASWRAALNTPGGAILGDTVRLRLAIENSGLEVTQSYRLEFAPKGTAPSCEAVASNQFQAVPNQASCGTSAICMQTTANYIVNDDTTDLLFGTGGSVVLGEAIESPANITGALTLPQNQFTELEYAITPTINASDSYCFRVTNNGTALDFYSRIPELSLQFDPIINPITLNNGLDITTLTPGTTTRVFASTTVTDFNGFADLVSATATVYRSGVGAACTQNNNNCYIESTASKCNFTNCAGDTCDLVCAIDIFFHADATDIGTFSGEEWFAFLEVEDSNGGYDFDTSLGVELFTVRAIDVQGVIDYGALAVNTDTGSFNASTTIINLGNVEVDIDVQGTDLTDGVNSFIPAEQQKFATSTFTYSLCGASCGVVSSSTPVEIDLNLFKPTAVVPPVLDEVYWGIAIPLGTNSASHQGFNIFTPISP